MTFYSLDGGRPLGSGVRTPLDRITDSELKAMVAGYKRVVASRYRGLTPEDLDLYTPPGDLHVSPKVDGELWFLVLDEDTMDAALVNPKGRVLHGDIPVLKEARSALSRCQGRTVVAGELFAVNKQRRPRVRDVGAALGGEANAEVGKLGFMAFDLLRGGDSDAQMPLETYAEKLEVIRRLFDGGKRAQAIRTEVVSGGDDVRRLYEEWVDSGKSEGLVLRSPDGRTHKVKPALDVDAVVLAYTERREDNSQIRSLLLGLVRDDGQVQVIGEVGGGFSDDKRREMKELLESRVTTSTYRIPDRAGALYRFVKAEVIIEVRIGDVQSDDAKGDPRPRMVLDYQGAEGWKAVRPMPGVSIIHPRFVRVRDDKSFNSTDVRMSQVLDRCIVDAVEQAVEAIDLESSVQMRREVYAKESKGSTMVRKLVMWKTCKEQVDPSYPAFVVHWTDYSPSRKDPLKREVRLAPNEEEANRIADAMITKGVKKGWEQVV